MHGRLKVKTTAEQAAEKAKEREEKRKQYTAALTHTLAKRASGSHDEEGLKLTAQLLAANPDATTLWNFRREILLAMKGEREEEQWEEVLRGELGVVEGCLLKNPKSYGAWHHRTWVTQHFPAPPWAAELTLCDKYLKLDARNFHCWDYRRFVVAGGSQQVEDELKFSQQLIERNLSNYSAWHYRSKLLPLVHPPPPCSPHPISEAALIKELAMVVDAVFTDPSDQSPWFYLRWLVNRQEKDPRLLQVCYVNHEDKEQDGSLVCVFTQPVCRTELPAVRLDQHTLDLSERWTAPTQEEYSRVWVVKDLVDEAECLQVGEGEGGVRLTVGAGRGRTLHWDHTTAPLSHTLLDTLEEVRSNCLTLDDIDPNNKWVLLTLVDVLWALDCLTHRQDIHRYLGQLRDLDPLRHHYYTDMQSKLVMETSVRQQYQQVMEEGVFSLSGQNLSHLSLTHLLASTTSVDLSGNSLTSLAPLVNLASCTYLNLSHNLISNLTPLLALELLECLVLEDNRIVEVNQLQPLTCLPCLVTLNLRNNTICDDGSSDMEVKQLMFRVKSLCLR